MNAKPDALPTFVVKSLVLQPTTFCNLRCDYCYLPLLGRESTNRMTLETIRRIAMFASELLPPYDEPLRIVWHAGEPLTFGLNAFHDALSAFEQERRNGKLIHSIQTNGTLIDERWCRLFKEFDVRIGLSIDGPRELNHHRVYRSGKGSVEQTIRGIDLLGRHEIPFGVILVVTNEQLHAGPVEEYAQTLYDFLCSISPISAGFNIEEKEHCNVSREAPEDDLVFAFWRALYSLQREPRMFEIRELATAERWLTQIAFTERDGLPARTREVDLIPTIDYRGNVTILSPELAGVQSEKFSNFVVGNVNVDALPTILDRARSTGYVHEFLQGVDACESSCGYFSYCGSRYCAANKFAETGRLDVTETAHCRHARIRPVQAIYSSWTDR